METRTPNGKKNEQENFNTIVLGTLRTKASGSGTKFIVDSNIKGITLTVKQKDGSLKNIEVNLGEFNTGFVSNDEKLHANIDKGVKSGKLSDEIAEKLHSFLEDKKVKAEIQLQIKD